MRGSSGVSAVSAQRGPVSGRSGPAGRGQPREGSGEDRTGREDPARMGWGRVILGAGWGAHSGAGGRDSKGSGQRSLLSESFSCTHRHGGKGAYMKRWDPCLTSLVLGWKGYSRSKRAHPLLSWCAFLSHRRRMSHHKGSPKLSPPLDPSETNR